MFNKIRYTLYAHFTIINKQMLTDTHCHLYYDDIKTNLKEILNRAEQSGVNRFICPSTNMDDVYECLRIAKSNDQIFCSAGIHPHDTKNAPENYIEKIFNLMNDQSMVAIGEIGLDYFRNISDKEVQKKCFKEQLLIAQEIDKPVIIHNRDADEDMINILSDFPRVVGVAHCFSSDLETANKFLEIGYYISFSGNLTFKNSHLPAVAKELPLDRILVETDSPFLSPVPFRGKPNEPSRVRYVAEKLAKIHNVSFEKVAKITSENATKIFKINV